MCVTMHQPSSPQVQPRWVGFLVGRVGSWVMTQFDNSNYEEEIERLNDDYTLDENIHSQWKNIDTNLRDLLLEKSPIKIIDIDFLKNKHSRHFSSSNYIQILQMERNTKEVD